MAHAFRVRRTFLGLSLVATILAFGGAAPAAAARYAEALPQVLTEGLTAEQHLELQVELSHRLRSELPQAALERAVRIPVTAEEIAAIDRAPRSVSPLKVGLVKNVAPGLLVAGLDRQGRAGAGGAVQRTADGGLVWAAVVRSDDAGAIRLRFENLSLPRNASLYVYARNGQAHGPTPAAAL